MNSITVSNSGTAWIKDMQAQGKPLDGGWANSANAAYYASLDTPGAAPATKPLNLPASLDDLLKLQRDAIDAKRDALADDLQQQIATRARADGLPASGNLLSAQA